LLAASIAGVIKPRYALTSVLLFSLANECIVASTSDPSR
jgi:hypothetical protein